MKDQTESPIFTIEELAQINELRIGFESLPERDKFLVFEALKPYFKDKK